MTKDELRAEEDYYSAMGLKICAGCEKRHGGAECSKCGHRYTSLFVPDKTIAAVREFERGGHERA